MAQKSPDDKRAAVASPYPCMAKLRPNATVEGWRDWLGGTDWEYFATFTTKYHLTLNSARRLMTSYSRRWLRRNDDRMFWVAEEFNHKTGYHLHALIRSELRATQIWKDWFDRHGRAQVLLYEPEVGAHGYVAKYVTKSIADYDMQIPNKGQIILLPERATNEQKNFDDCHLHTGRGRPRSKDRNRK